MPEPRPTKDPWQPTSFDADGLPQFDEPPEARDARLPVTFGPRDPAAPAAPPRPAKDRSGLTRPRVLMWLLVMVSLAPVFVFLAGMVDGAVDDEDTAILAAGAAYAAMGVLTVVRAAAFKVAIEDHWLFVRRWGRWHGPVDLDRTTTVAFRTVYRSGWVKLEDLEIRDADLDELTIDARNHSVDELLAELATWFGPDDVAPSGRARSRMAEHWD